MNARQSTFVSIVIASLAAAFAGSARGQEAPTGPTRAEVKALVLEARDNGELMPAGEVPVPFAAAKSIRARSDVKAEVIPATRRRGAHARGNARPRDPASEPVLPSGSVRRRYTAGR